MNMDKTVKIVPFEKKFSEDFKRLNMEWLERYDLFETADLKHLDDPYQTIIMKAGKILIAIEEGEVVGTSAIVVKNKNTVELAKFAVSSNSQGKGIGKRLAIESITLAKDMGAELINLVSNSKLYRAIHLYESLGFEHKPLPEEIDYKTADVYMELKIKRPIY